MITLQTIQKLSKGEPKWLKEKRIHAFEKYKEEKPLLFKYGPAIVVSLQELDFEKRNPLEKKDNVFVDAKEAEVLTLEEALQKEDLKKYFESKKENKLTFFHQAFFNNLIIIQIPENKLIKNPIKIHSNQQSDSRIEYIFIIANQNSKATIQEIATSSKSKDQKFKSHVIHIIAKENASITYCAFQHLGKEVINHTKRYAHISKDAEVMWITESSGAAWSQEHTKSYLLESGAKSQMNGLILGDKNQVFDSYTSCKHQASRTKSDLITKIILNDQAKATYQGQIKIQKDAKKCNGSQSEHTLLLSKDAKINAVPFLEIENNDVVCSHTTSMTQLDKEKLFYLESRGLNSAKAKQMLIKGFLSPLLKEVKQKEEKKFIKILLNKKIKRIQ